MLLGTRRVTAPDGTEWRVSVDWHKAHVRLPSAWRRRRDARKRDPTDWLDPCDCGPADDVVAGLVLLLAFAMVALLPWFLIWPLLALAIELLIALLAVLLTALVRVAFGRPWLLEAEAEGHPTRRWAIRGVGSANRCIGEIADALAAGLEPAPMDADRACA